MKQQKIENATIVMDEHGDTRIAWKEKGITYEVFSYGSCSTKWRGNAFDKHERLRRVILASCSTAHDAVEDLRRYVNGPEEAADGPAVAPVPAERSDAWWDAKLAEAAPGWAWVESRCLDNCKWFASARAGSGLVTIRTNGVFGSFARDYGATDALRALVRERNADQLREHAAKSKPQAAAHPTGNIEHVPPEPVAVTATRTCPDCKGSKRYVSTLVDEPCRLCAGKGTVAS